MFIDTPPDSLRFQVDSLQNFTWQQQLRYYWDMDLDDCLIRHSDARVRYGYEYMGATRWVLLPDLVCLSVCMSRLSAVRGLV